MVWRINDISWPWIVNVDVVCCRICCVAMKQHESKTDEIDTSHTNGGEPYL
jgi:hypothetical protein